MPIIADPTAPAPPLPTKVTGSDGVLTAYLDEPNAGVLLVADFSGASQVPARVRFYRDDGVLVRSGDWAWAPGGIAVAYDHEMSLSGSGHSWYAHPDVGADCQRVTLTVPAPSDLSTVWLKGLDSPGLSMQVVVSTWPRLHFAGRLSVSPVLGSAFPAFPAITQDLRQAPTSQMQVWTTTFGDSDALRLLVSSGVLLLQPNAKTGRRDQYVAIGDVDADLVGLPQGERLLWTLPLTEVERPATTGQRLRVPDRSYADRLATWPLYEGVPARSYLDGLTGGT